MKKLLIEKKVSYAKYVKEMHLPHRSKKKEKELKELIESLKHPVKNPVKYSPSSFISSVKRS